MLGYFLYAIETSVPSFLVWTAFPATGKNPLSFCYFGSTYLGVPMDSGKGGMRVT